MSTVDWRAVWRGALAGLLVVIPVSVVYAVLDRSIHGFVDSAWSPLFALAILAAYVLAGAVAGLVGPDAPLSNGALGALGALVLWLPVRLVIWAVRDDGRGLFAGHKAALAPGQLFGQAVFAIALGMVGGLVGRRGARLSPGGEPAGRPRTDSERSGDPSEERPDSIGQGAG